MNRRRTREPRRTIWENGEPSPIVLRAFVPIIDDAKDDDAANRHGDNPKRRRQNWSRRPPGPSPWTLVFDTETSVDPAQRLRFGTYQVRKGDECLESGIFFDPDALTKKEQFVLRYYSTAHGLKLLTVSDFIEGIFFRIGHDYRASIVGFNLPYDLSRLADHHTTARRKAKGGAEMQGGFSLRLSSDPSRTRIQIKHLSSRAALIRFTGPPGQRHTRSERKRGEKRQVRRGFFVDLKTLAAALLSRSFSLGNLADFLETEHRKLGTEEHGQPVTPDYVAYAVQDVQVTWECFLKLSERYAVHGLTRTRMHNVYSEASLGKGYLKEMGVRHERNAI